MCKIRIIVVESVPFELAAYILYYDIFSMRAHRKDVFFNIILLKIHSFKN